MSRASPGGAEATAAAIETQLANLYKACPGIVRSYDGATKTITVQPVTNRPITDADGQLSHEAQPEIQNVPVEFFGSSNLSVVTELEQGDSVLLVFLDYSPAGWRRTGKPADAGDARAHGPSYCVAFPWYRPSGGAGQDQDTASIGKPGGPVRVHFEAGTVTVGTAGGGDFVALKPAIDQIQQAVDTTVSYGTPWGPTFVGNLAPIGPVVSSTKLKA